MKLYENYYYAKAARAAKDKPSHWMIVPHGTRGQHMLLCIKKQTC